MHKLTVSYGKYLVCILIYSGSCSSISKFFMWLSDAVTDRKPTRHRPTRTWAGLPIQKLKKFRVKNIFPSSRKKSNNQKFWNSKKAKILIFLNPGEFRKFWFFEKISVLFGAFFMIHGAARPNENSYLVAVERRRLGILGTLHD